MAVDTLQIVREIYGPSYMLHYGIYERSVAHRKQHGESQCDVYPSTAIHSLWPLLAAIVDAERFLEVGGGLGYTAAFMAEAGGKSARVDTIEKLVIHAALAAEEMSNAGLEDRVRILRGQATEVLEDLSGPYDVIFVDADWQDYPKWLPHFARLTRKGGVLVSDNLFPSLKTGRSTSLTRNRSGNTSRRWSMTVGSRRTLPVTNGKHSAIDCEQSEQPETLCHIWVRVYVSGS